MAKAGGTPAPKAPAAAKAPGKPQQPRRDKAAAADTGPKTQAKGTGEVPARLKEHFARTVVPALMKDRGYTNVWQVPRLHKIVINMGVGEGRENAKVMDFATADLQLIAGQKPVVTRAKKSIANFKLREGVPIGGQGDAAQRPHVRVSRSAHQHRPAPRAGLQGRAAQGLRRARQLRARPA